MLRGDTVLAELCGDAALPHGQRLPLDLARVLEQAGVQPSEVSLLAVAAGPGSYTGMRIGIATMQGLAMASGARIVPVSTLEALARGGTAGPESIGAWMDAQRGEVYAALYGPGGGRVRLAPIAASPAAVLSAWAETIGAGSVRFIGDGAVHYREAIESALGPRATILAAPPLAGLVGQIAAGHPDRAVLPHAVVPIYVRKPDVELARDRRSGPS